VHRRSIFLDDSACGPVRAQGDSRRMCSRLSRGGPAQARHEAPQPRAAQRAVEWSACVASRAEPACCRNFRRRRCRLRLSPRRLWASTVLRPGLVRLSPHRETWYRGERGIASGPWPLLKDQEGPSKGPQLALGKRTNLIRPLARLPLAARRCPVARLPHAADRLFGDLVQRHTPPAFSVRVRRVGRHRGEPKSELSVPNPCRNGTELVGLST
jgi:hypothetical protein